MATTTVAVAADTVFPSHGFVCIPVAVRIVLADCPIKEPVSLQGLQHAAGVFEGPMRTAVEEWISLLVRCVPALWFTRGGHGSRRLSQGAHTDISTDSIVLKRFREKSYAQNTGEFRREGTRVSSIKAAI
ncbi:hypothetical protein MMC14_001492 [Varicellaria rhodocarpa]|nr:hypothetical protein [Varicellaria rhodocarpa]